jgi:superfamily II DNA or RNA helicase
MLKFSKLSNNVVCVVNTKDNVFSKFVDLLEDNLCYTHKKLVPIGWRKKEWKFEKRRPYYVDANENIFLTLGSWVSLSPMLSERSLIPSVVEASSNNLLSGVYAPDVVNMTNKLNSIGMVLRPEQRQIIEAIANNEVGIIKVPAGTGKTSALWPLTELFPKANFAVATYSTDLVNSIRHGLRIANVGDREFVVNEEVFQFGAGRSDTLPIFRNRRWILVSTGRMLEKIYCQCAYDSRPDFLIVDEAHLLTDNQSMYWLGKIAQYCRIFAMTATPEGRADGADLLMRSLYGPIIFECSYEVPLRSKSILPIRICWKVCDKVVVDGHELDSDRIKYLRKDPVEFARACFWKNQHRNQIVASCADNHGDDKVLILVKTIEHADNILKVLPEFVPVDKRLSGKGRRVALSEFKKGIIRKVVSTVWGTGISVNDLQCAIVATGSGKKSDAYQYAGRTNRVDHDNQNKIVGQVYDIYDKFATYASNQRKAVYLEHGWIGADDVG